MGDVDGQNGINNTDVTYAVNHVVGISQLTGENLQAADISDDESKVVNNTDVTHIVNYVVNINRVVIDGVKTIATKNNYVTE